MEAMEAILTRRSTRRFQDRKVERELLNKVLDAGRYAPSGGNNQYGHFLVIENKEVMDKLAVMAESAFSKMEIMPDTYSSLAHSITASKKGGYVFHYNTPALILYCNKPTYSNNLADTGCALENMMVACNALDLGSVWINQLKWLNEDPDIVLYLHSLGMKEDERVYGGLAIGYPDTADGLPNRKALERKGNFVDFIE